MREAQVKVAVVVLVMAVATYALAGTWLTKALKVGNAAIYVSIFYAAIWIVLGYVTLRGHKPNIAVGLVTSALLGHVAATLASVVLHLGQPDGLQRFSNSVHQFGI